MALVSLLPHCENQEKLALLHVFSLMAKDNPSVFFRLQESLIDNNLNFLAIRS